MQKLTRKEKTINKSYFNHSGIIEVGVFATEEVAERVADKVGVANQQVGMVM